MYIHADGALIRTFSSLPLPIISLSLTEKLPEALNVLARLCCHGVTSTPVIGVAGLEPVGVSRDGLPAVEIPAAEGAPFFLRLSDVLPVVLLLHLRCLSSGFCFPRRSSSSGVGVVLREEDRECDPSRSRAWRRLDRLLFSLREFCCERLWLRLW